MSDLFLRPDPHRYPGFPCVWSGMGAHDSTHRYVLWRLWDETRPYLLGIGLNPSHAAEDVGDMTVNRLIQWGRAWGYGALAMTNLFAARSPDPKVMMASPDPVGGPQNDVWIERLARGAGLCLALWGNGGDFMDRAAAFVAGWHTKGLPQLHCLGTTSSGAPTHPMARGRSRLPDDVRPVPWHPRAVAAE